MPKHKQKKEEDQLLQKTKQLMFITNEAAEELPKNYVKEPLKFSAKDLITIWLQGILPPSILKQIKLNLESKFIFGPKTQCRAIIKDIEHFLKQNCVKNLKGKQIVMNRKLYMQNLFACKIFEKSQIQKCIKEMIECFQSDQVKPLQKMIKGQKYFYLIAFNRMFQNKFQAYLSTISITPEPLREDIMKANQMHQKLKKQCLINSVGQKKQQEVREQVKEQSSSSSEQSSEEKVAEESENESESSEGETNFYSQLIQKKQPVIEKKEKKEKKKKKEETEIEEKPNSQIKRQPLLNRDYLKSQPKKQVAKKWSYPNNLFKIQLFLEWVSKNKALREEDFCFTFDPQAEDQILMHLYNTKQANKLKAKLTALEIYQKFNRIFRIKKTLNSNLRTLEKQLFKFYPPELIQCKFVHGFMRPNTNEHALRNLIIYNKIQKSQLNTEPFVCVSIVGMKNLVDDIYEKLSQKHEELPNEDFSQTLEIDIGKLQAYANDKRVKKLILDEIQKKVGEFDFIEIRAHKLSNDGLHLKLKVENTELSIYINTIRDQILQFFLKNTFCYFFDSKTADLSQNLKDRFLVIQESQNQWVLIDEKNNIMKTIGQIMQQMAQQNQHTKQIIKTSKNVIIRVKQEENKIISQLKNSQQITIHYEEDKIIITGPKKYVQSVVLSLNDFIRNISQAEQWAIIYMNQIQIRVLQKEEHNLQKHIQGKYGITFELKNGIKYGTVITLGKSNVIDLQSPIVIRQYFPNSIKSLPYRANFFFKNADQLKHFHDSVLDNFSKKIKGRNKNFVITDRHEGHMFLYTQGYNKTTQVHQFIEYCRNNNKNTNNYVFFLPRRENERNQMLLKIIEQFQKLYQQNSNEQLTVFLVNEGKIGKISLKSHEKTDTITIDKIIYYITDGAQKFQYAQSGNNKINDAIKSGKDKVYLCGADINYTAISHQCDLDKKIIRHRLTGKQFPIKTEKTRITFELEGQQFEFPQSEFEKAGNHADPKNYWKRSTFGMQGASREFGVALGVYEIDINRRVQRNMFSGYQRKLEESIKKEDIELVCNMNVSENHEGGEIRIIYGKQKKDAIEDVKEFFHKKLQEEETSIKIQIGNKIKPSVMKSIQEYADCDNIQIIIEGCYLKAISYDRASINKFQKILPSLLNASQPIEYPKEWQPQTEDIQVFTVPEHKQQFKDIQAQIKFGKIVELRRIQNKLIYKRYFEQRQNLKQLNESDDIKELILYHGTHATDPKIIYEDKEECFNINYSSQNNYLGKGTYFAVKPEYSHNYSCVYEQKIQGKNVRGFMLCSVIVGDSQLIPKVNQESQKMKDTIIKDKKKKIKYESSTTYTAGSTIYAVYRNKRAYPKYLIRYIVN